MAKKQNSALIPCSRATRCVSVRALAASMSRIRVAAGMTPKSPLYPPKLVLWFPVTGSIVRDMNKLDCTSREPVWSEVSSRLADAPARQTPRSYHDWRCGLAVWTTVWGG